MNVELVTIHCSDTDNNQHVSLAAIQRFHEEKFKLPGIAYHVILQPDGTRENTRPLNVTGHHVAMHNSNNIGVCLAGRDRFTEKQFETLRYFLHSLELAFNWRSQNLFAHHDFDTAKKQGKQCPFMRSADIVHWYLSGKDDAIEKYLL